MTFTSTFNTFIDFLPLPPLDKVHAPHPLRSNPGSATERDYSMVNSSGPYP